MKKISIIIIIGIVSIPIRHLIEDRTKSDKKDYSSYSNFIDAPASVRMFISLKENSEKYNIPMNFALGVAYVETSYSGPLQWNYNPERSSYAGALGPMQIMPGTAKLIWGNVISNKKLTEDIDFNVETSMKLLNKLYKKYKNWKIVFGCYNTGKPCINKYAEKVYNFKPSNI